LVSEITQALAEDQIKSLEAQVKLESEVVPPHIIPPNQTPEPLEPDSKEMLVAELQAVLLGELGDELEKHAEIKVIHTGIYIHVVNVKHYIFIVKRSFGFMSVQRS
jgi:hypothetical protein